ncbi:HAD family hydrolase [Pseudooceanicola sp. 200-1SW]|uniref:HAD family hydrolase n=1 Tax=Pseudooceanicola sp. 200-1SW TaxID=3425949 RepID=UPI003D7FB3CF
MTDLHVIWDWNGTLLDDFEITAEVSAEMIRTAGRPDVTHDDIRDHHTRPFSHFFHALVGREPTEQEMAANMARYSQVYDPIKHQLPLAADALHALELLKESGAGQSVLSMAPQDELRALVSHNGIADYFRAIDGAETLGQDRKRASLERHMGRLGLMPARTVLIGDTVDDFDAASALGIRAVLVTTGMHSARRLAATGSDVADTLLGAARLALHGQPAA